MHVGHLVNASLMASEISMFKELKLKSQLDFTISIIYIYIFDMHYQSLDRKNAIFHLMYGLPVSLT